MQDLSLFMQSSWLYAYLEQADESEEDADVRCFRIKLTFFKIGNQDSSIENQDFHRKSGFFNRKRTGSHAKLDINREPATMIQHFQDKVRQF